MTAVPEMLRALAARTAWGCHLCGLLPTSGPSRGLGCYPDDGPSSGLLEDDPDAPRRLLRCRDRGACDRRQRLTPA